MCGAVTVVTVAVAIGTAVATDFAAFAVIAAVGATIGAVGKLTGIKELAIAGTIIGAVGGIGGLAQSAGLIGDVFGEGISALGPAGDAARASSHMAGGAVDEAGFAGVDWASQGGNFTSASTGAELPGGSVIDSLNVGGLDTGSVTTSPLNDVVTQVSPTQDISQLTSEASPGILGDAQVQAPDGVINTATADPANIAGVSTPEAPGVLSPNAPSSSTTGGVELDANGQVIQGDAVKAPVQTAAPASTPVDATTPATQPTATQPAVTPTDAKTIDPTMANTGPDPKAAAEDSLFGNLWNKFSKMGSGSGALLGGAIQGGAAFLSGAFSTLTPAQVKQANAQAAANTAAANISNMQLANMQAPLPSARSVPVTGASPGIINSPPPQQRVTGGILG